MFLCRVLQVELLPSTLKIFLDHNRIEYMNSRKVSFQIVSTGYVDESTRPRTLDACSRHFLRRKLVARGIPFARDVSFVNMTSCLNKPVEGMVFVHGGSCIERLANTERNCCTGRIQALQRLVLAILST